MRDCAGSSARVRTWVERTAVSSWSPSKESALRGQLCRCTPTQAMLFEQDQGHVGTSCQSLIDQHSSVFCDPVSRATRSSVFVFALRLANSEHPVQPCALDASDLTNLWPTCLSCCSLTVTGTDFVEETHTQVWSADD